MSRLSLSSLSKSFGSKTVLKGIDLEVPEGSFCALLGPSGSGKTTILNIVAGIESADTGTIDLGGRSLAGLPPERRNIGVVFQSYALFPHLSVADNIAFGLKSRKVAREEQRRRVAEVLDLVGLGELAGRKPAQLSGGQQQRVALARALVIEPDLLLLDEPLSALDRKVRGDMQAELARIHRETGVTTVMVTHDQEEALSLADQVVLLNDGEIQQRDTPERMYRNPSSPFVAGFMGVQHFPGVVRTPDCAGTQGSAPASAPCTVLDVAGLTVAGIAEPAAGVGAAAGGGTAAGHEEVPDGRNVVAAIAAEAISVCAAELAPSEGAGRAIVSRIVFLGPTAEVIVAVDGGPEIRALLLSRDAVGLKEGSEVEVSIDPAGVRVWPRHI